MKEDDIGQRSSLSDPRIQAQLKALVDAGLTLSDIRNALGLVVSRQAIHKRLTALGLQLHRKRIGAHASAPGGKVLGQGAVSAEAAEYRLPARNRSQPFLSTFRTELDDLLVGAQHSYAEIWDELKRRHPFVPQLSALESAREKSLRISVWVLRERRKRKERLERKSQP
ncbi:MAG: hypothetical protein H0U56_09070 [Methylibium sp.]|nr:hypothetical protein [Methylibium sp.]